MIMIHCCGVVACDVSIDLLHALNCVLSNSQHTVVVLFTYFLANYVAHAAKLLPSYLRHDISCEQFKRLVETFFGSQLTTTQCKTDTCLTVSFLEQPE